MNAIRALIWKEGREQAYKVLVGLGFCLALLLLRLDADFNKELIRWDGILGQLFGLAAAALLAIDAVAGERSRGTWALMSSRPLGLERLLAVKFVVGALGLLLLIGGYWAVIYALPYAWVGIENRYVFDIILLREVGYWGQIFLFYTGFLMLYACCFLGSAWAVRPVMGLANGLATAAGALLLTTAVAFLVSLQAGRAFYNFAAGVQLFGLPISAPGYMMRLVYEEGLVAAKWGLVLAVVLLAWRLAAWAGLSLRGRWPLWIGGVAAAGLGWCIIIAVVISAELLPQWIKPVAVLDLPGKVRGLAVADDLAFLAFGQGREHVGEVQVVDLQKPLEPRHIGHLSLPEWSYLERTVMVDSVAYVKGNYKYSADSDSRRGMGLLTIDLHDPARPEAVGYFDLKTQGNMQYMTVYEGAIYLLLWQRGALYLQTLDAAGGGVPRPVHCLLLQAAPAGVDSLGRFELVALQGKVEMRIIDRRAYVPVGLEVAVLDLREPLRPVELGRSRVEHVGRSATWWERQYSYEKEGDSETLMWFSGSYKRAYKTVREKVDGPDGATRRHSLFFLPRLVTVADIHDGRLYVERNWPREMVAMDLGPEGLPVERDYALWNKQQLQWRDGLGYEKSSGSVFMWEWEGGGRLGSATILDLPREEGDQRAYQDHNDVTVFFADEYICTVLDNKLVLFPSLAAVTDRAEEQ
ncbi:MAG: hypothetical protein GKR89_17445 [Candidatus Latescibacteria bacterium]|nr:hypothetical protein [Candidatus Latescibacterota bacterium]